MPDPDDSRRPPPIPPLRVAVVFGGRSAEHSISCVSAGSVMAALARAGHAVVPIGIGRDGRWVLTDADPAALRLHAGSLPEVGEGTAVTLPTDPAERAVLVVDPVTGPRRLAGVDVVFPVLHGSYGEDGTIQGLLEMAGIPYVGSGVLSSAVTMDKDFTKRLLAAAGLPVGPYAVLRPGHCLPSSELDRLGLPVFVKPARAGSSVGISRVTDAAGMSAAISLAQKTDPKVLVEAAIVGREIECGVLVVDGVPRASLPAELTLVGEHDWYDFAAKYTDPGAKFTIPAKLSPQTTENLRAMAVTAFEALECADLARVDFFVGPDEELIVNEVNTMPGFTAISMYARAWEATGIGFDEVVDILVRSAAARVTGLH